MVNAFDDENLVIRVTGDTIALTPPLIVSESQIGEIFDKVARVIKAARARVTVLAPPSRLDVLDCLGFRHHIVRPPARLAQDAADIFADDAEHEELRRAQNARSPP